MRTETRTNSRTARRARCPKPKARPQKVAALVPTPPLPDAYAFGEIQPQELLVLNARQLPAIEPKPVVLPESARLRASAPGKTAWERLRTGGQWSFRLGLRWELPGRISGLPWIPQITRREASYEAPARPERPERPASVVDAEKLSRTVHVGLARAIRELREERYLDASQLADDAEIPRWQLTAVEEARLSPIPFAVFFRLSEALNMKLSELLRRIEEAGTEAEQ
jgi:DNA-binding Xre family transcriptional regulator